MLDKSAGKCYLNEGVSYFNAFGRRDLWSRCSRSAGACPPRVFGGPQSGEGQALALRGRGAVFRIRTPPATVARGPVPRDRWNARTMARDRPSPYGNAHRFFFGCIVLGPTDLKKRRDVFSVARAMARDRPSPYAERGFLPPYCIETRRSLLRGKTIYETSSF